MDDVVGQIVLAVGDEDLLAGDAIGAVGRALGAGAHRADIGARLRLGQVHRAGPLAGDELLEVGLERSEPWASASIAPMVSTGPMPKAMEAEFHISTQAELSDGQPLAAPIGRRGKRVPAGVGPGR